MVVVSVVGVVCWGVAVSDVCVVGLVVWAGSSPHATQEIRVKRERKRARSRINRDGCFIEYLLLVDDFILA